MQLPASLQPDVHPECAMSARHAPASVWACCAVDEQFSCCEVLPDGLMGEWGSVMMSHVRYIIAVQVFVFRFELRLSSEDGRKEFSAVWRVWGHQRWEQYCALEQ